MGGAAHSASQWARRFARARGSQFFFETPTDATVPIVLDIASKQDVDYLVCGLRSRRVGPVCVPDGSGWLSEAAEARASRLVRQIVRTTSCPILSV